jgi:competence protein ComEA
MSGGLTPLADKIWTEKYLNRTVKLTDGQKVYIQSVNEQLSSVSAKNGGGNQTISPNFSSDSNTLININTASFSQLDSLPGIGQVYGQSIIEHRPYSTLGELVSNGAIKQSLFDKIKNLLTIY